MIFNFLEVPLIFRHSQYNKIYLTIFKFFPVRRRVISSANKNNLIDGFITVDTSLIAIKQRITLIIDPFTTNLRKNLQIDSDIHSLLNSTSECKKIIKSYVTQN